MAIKLDMEKAYDKISWELINVSLVAAGIPKFLRKVIMGIISSSTMQILWNGVPSKSFKLDHLYLTFFFADDLVIFGKAEIDQAFLLKEILKRFYDFSGHKISARKSNMYFSKGVDNSSRDRISQLFGFQEVFNLRIYLGVPLLHDQVTKSTLNLVVEKVRGKLHNWEARKLSFTGRVTLAQSVILTIPSYFMQSLLILKRVCDEIEKIVRQFIWGVLMDITRLLW
ncbi:Retrovirus-related Pol polyprotein LINE-1 [Gossypium australe]|uniref:Retrovirus-related Pol polyprotein LINE-1 n=1 Tax=Gossypium australe TaxID=47621 RepID=A0A5B6WRV6_9ROSI|nr:Retrovirus-related Pol polyprotein LINE-1 [Gossypium australe]